MAIARVDLHSDALGTGASLTVVLPQRTAGLMGSPSRAREGGHPVLYLLHGLSDDDTSWARRTSLERCVAPLGLVVVMPSLRASWCSDTVTGERFWTYLAEELPAFAASTFNLSTRREDTFVAGVSMGGYGAVKWALRAPERFAAAASFSGALDVAGLRHDPGLGPVLERVFGEAPPPEDDVYELLRRADPAALPALYACCGTEDQVLEQTPRFAEAARAQGVPVTVELAPGGHEWAYWDRALPRALNWLPLPGDVPAAPDDADA